MKNDSSFFRKVKPVERFTKWYGNIESIFQLNDQKRKEALRNLSHIFARMELASFIERVDYVTDDFCTVRLRTNQRIDREELIQLEHALRLSTDAFRSPISGKIEKGYTEATRNLLKHVKAQNLEEITKDLKNGADANAIYDPVSDHPSVLHVAVLLKRADIVKMLLEYDADPNIRVRSESPLSLAYDGSYEAKDVIKILLFPQSAASEAFPCLWILDLHPRRRSLLYCLPSDSS